MSATDLQPDDEPDKALLMAFKVQDAERLLRAMFFGRPVTTRGEIARCNVVDEWWVSVNCNGGHYWATDLSAITERFEERIVGVWSGLDQAPAKHIYAAKTQLVGKAKSLLLACGLPAPPSPPKGRIMRVPATSDGIAHTIYGSMRDCPACGVGSPVAEWMVATDDLGHKPRSRCPDCGLLS